jgi:dipeptide transport system ATP-binding protein
MAQRPELRDWRSGQVRCHYPLGDAGRNSRIEHDGRINPVKLETAA